jgi:hypothetical protein
MKRKAPRDRSRRRRQDQNSSRKRRSGLWRTFSSRTSPSSSSTSRSGPRAVSRADGEGALSSYVGGVEAPAAVAVPGRRSPSPFEMPPPLYEMVDLEPRYEGRLSGAPRYEWEYP